MALSVETLTWDCRSQEVVARFWTGVLGYEVVEVDEEDALIRDPKGAGWPILFQSVPEGKTVKNRLHIDVSPIDREPAEEVERLIALGARRVDIGQGEVRWTVLADPEGNEFCVLLRLGP